MFCTWSAVAYNLNKYIIKVHKGDIRKKKKQKKKQKQKQKQKKEN